MEDRDIVKLYFQRDERAIKETSAKYGRLCYSIASRVLGAGSAAEESVNDSYLAVWNAIPPTVPQVFSAFLSKVTRNTALRRLRSDNALKRGGGESDASLSELADCFSDGVDEPWEQLAAGELAKEISAFLQTLPADQRVIFMRRYFHFETIAEIAKTSGFTESKVKMSLKRTREKLAAHLKEKGYMS